MVGNPNSGKSSLFNAFTGLNQHVGNFPGVTVDKKTGLFTLEDNLQAELIDLPGTYSLYPRRADEWVAYKVLMGADAEIKADLIVLVADASNLKRNLLFCSQIIDLKIPVVMALTMNDLAAKKDIKIDISGLEADLGIPVVAVNPRKNKGLNELKKVISKMQPDATAKLRDFMDTASLAPEAVAKVRQAFPTWSEYACIHQLINHDELLSNNQEHAILNSIVVEYNFNTTKTQAEEIMQRYTRIRQIMQKNVLETGPLEKKLFTEKLDNILMHKTWGYLILFSVLFLLYILVGYLSNGWY